MDKKRKREKNESEKRVRGYHIVEIIKILQNIEVSRMMNRQRAVIT